MSMGIPEIVVMFFLIWGFPLLVYLGFAVPALLNCKRAMDDLRASSASFGV